MNLVTLNHKTFPFLYKCCSAQLVFKRFKTETNWSLSSNENKRVAVVRGWLVKSKRAKEKGEGGKREGEERTEEVQTGVRPLRGAGGQRRWGRWGSRGRGKERGWR